MTEYSLRKIIPIYNDEEKLDEINRLLDILSKRKRCSILIAMLLVFQKYKFQKLLKEFLFEGVQQIIHNNPYKVVSFTGVPFSVKNCLMGMRVIIGKHRMFKREMIEGYEYLNVQLVYTCIFLSDEIAKICKGSKNRKPVHSSLLDELDIVENSNTLEEINNNDNNILENSNSNLINKESDEQQLNNINNNIEYEQRYSETNSGGFENEYKGYDNNIISLGESEESEEYGKNRKNKNYSKLKKKSNHKNYHGGVLYNNKKNNGNNIFGNIFYPKDNNYFRCGLQDYLNLWYFDKSAPVNIYLKDNERNISELKNIFDKLELAGVKCQNYLLDLMKYVPELNKAYKLDSKNNNENAGENNNINISNDELKESKEILDKINYMNNIYKEYENKSELLINIFQRIKTTVDNIKQSSIDGEKVFLKDDLNYLQKINNRYNEIILEILPLFQKIYEYNKELRLKNISSNLQSVNNNLKENNLSLKSFSDFIENWNGLFPNETKNMNTVNDLLANYSLSEREREEKFIEIISKEKENLINSIEQCIKNF